MHPYHWPLRKHRSRKAERPWRRSVLPCGCRRRSGFYSSSLKEGFTLSSARAFISLIRNKPYPSGQEVKDSLNNIDLEGDLEGNSTPVRSPGIAFGHGSLGGAFRGAGINRQEN